jgi:hypothetical protein
MLHFASCVPDIKSGSVQWCAVGGLFDKLLKYLRIFLSPQLKKSQWKLKISRNNAQLKRVK